MSTDAIDMKYRNSLDDTPVMKIATVVPQNEEYAGAGTIENEVIGCAAVEIVEFEGTITVGSDVVAPIPEPGSPCR